MTQKTDRIKNFINISNIIGVLAGVIGVGVAIYFGVRQTPERSAQWIIETQGSLVNINQDIARQGDIEVLFNGEPAENVGFMVLTFTNTGGLPIEEGDYAAPLTLEFNENSKLFSAEITQKHPENLDITYSLEETKITFSETLINQGESFSVQIIGSNLSSSPIVDGRIVGINNLPILDRKAIEQQLSFSPFEVFIAFILAALFNLIILFPPIAKTYDGLILAKIVKYIASIVLMITALLSLYLTIRAIT